MKKVFSYSIAIILLWCCSMAFATPANTGVNTGSTPQQVIDDKSKTVETPVADISATHNTVAQDIMALKLARWEAKKAQYIPEPVPGMILQGGEDCSNFYDLGSALPATDAGTTVGAVNNYGPFGSPTPTCWVDYYSSTSSGAAPDVTYKWTAPAAGSYTFSLCGSGYDTALELFDFTCPTEPVYPGDFICGNDDACLSTLQSEIANISLSAGQAVLVVVDGYGTSTGTYTLNITGTIPGPQGDICADPIVVTGIPYTNAQNSCDFNNDYFLSGADIVYEMTLATPMTLTISLCNSPNALYDSYLGVLAAADCGTTNFLVADDDACTSPSFGTSEIYGYNFPAGTYYILVDGYGGCDNLVLDITEVTTCVLACGPDDVFEGEPDCGPQYDDIYNGGCNSTPFVFQPYTFGDTICGTSGTFRFFDGVDSLQYRDTDWFIVDLAEAGTLTWTGCAEFPINLYLIGDPTGGCVYSVEGSVGGNACETVTVSAPVPAGIHYLFVAPGLFSGYDCPLEYRAWGSFVALPPCVPDYTVSGVGSHLGSTLDSGDDCYLREANDEIWEVNIPDAGTWTFSMCNGPLFDSYMYLGTSCCGNELAFDDDFCGGFSASQISMNLDPGTYYVTIEGWGVTDMGDYQLDITYTPPVVLECPPGGIPEGEPDCGPDYVDTYNGGCNSSPWIWQDIDFGDWICGTSGTYNLGRDTDWFRVSVGTSGILAWTAVAEFPIQLIILDAGTENCVDYTIPAIGTAAAGVTLSIQTLVDPGIYWLWAGPSVFTGWDCPLDYNAIATFGDPVFGVDMSVVNGSAPAGGSDSEILTVSNTGTGLLSFTVENFQDSTAVAGYVRHYPMSTSARMGEPGSKGAAISPVHPSNPHTILQGGEDIASAVSIPSIPYSNTGTILGYIDDYEEVCDYTSTSPDVVYSYTPAANQTLTISLCAGSDYDTKLFVYANAATPGSPYACNDDACSSPNFPDGPFVSRISLMDVFVGNTYYIVVDGYGGAAGNYTIDITEYVECVLVCPEPNTPEGEPDCGQDYDDLYNGGCNAVDPVFSPLNAGDLICGATGVYDFFGSTYRDLDWYLYYPTGPSLLTLTGASQTGYLLGFVVPASTDPCDNDGNFTTYFVAPPCTTASVSISVDGSVPIIIIATTDSWDLNYACGSPYWFEFTVAPAWLSTNTFGGVVFPGESMPVTVNMDASTLTEGTYYGRTVFNTNEPAATLHTVPVTLVVTAGGCSYIPGDLNGIGGANGIDVTYGVTYLKGGTAPHDTCFNCPTPGDTLLAPMDVNGSCSANGIDITYFVAYLKLIQPSLKWCLDCPPPVFTAPLPGQDRPAIIKTKKAVSNQQ